jgi:hypothetical protein
LKHNLILEILFTENKNLGEELELLEKVVLFFSSLGPSSNCKQIGLFLQNHSEKYLQVFLLFGPFKET